MKSLWKDEVAATDLERIPNTEKIDMIKNSLLMLNPDFIAVGHGFCVDCKEV